MKNKIIIAIIAIAGIALAQSGVIMTSLYDKVTDGATVTEYFGEAQVAPNYTPSETNNEWQITRFVTVSNVLVSVKTAAGIGTGDAYWKSAKWSDRASTNTVYK